MFTQEDLQTGLSQFTQVDGWYQHWLNKFVFTDGVKWLCDQTRSRWLLNEIALYQAKIKADYGNLEPFQIWQIHRLSASAVLLSWGQQPTQPPLFQKQFKTSDFALEQVSLWLVSGILMLPSEYRGYQR